MSVSRILEDEHHRFYAMKSDSSGVLLRETDYREALLAASKLHVSDFSELGKITAVSTYYVNLPVEAG